MELFGLQLDSFYLALARVESQCGKCSSNVYQIRPLYVADCNRILSLPGWRYRPDFRLCDIHNRAASEEMMRLYWRYYIRPLRRAGIVPSYIHLARIHNGGPNGCTKSATLKYWHLVRDQLSTITHDDACRWMTNYSPAYYRSLLTTTKKETNK